MHLLVGFVFLTLVVGTYWLQNLKQQDISSQQIPSDAMRASTAFFRQHQASINFQKRVAVTGGNALSLTTGMTAPYIYPPFVPTPDSPFFRSMRLCVQATAINTEVPCYLNTPISKANLNPDALHYIVTFGNLPPQISKGDFIAAAQSLTGGMPISIGTVINVAPPHQLQRFFHQTPQTLSTALSTNSLGLTISEGNFLTINIFDTAAMEYLWDHP